jgi:hypothetical protein
LPRQFHLCTYRRQSNRRKTHQDEWQTKKPAIPYHRGSPFKQGQCIDLDFRRKSNTRWVNEIYLHPEIDIPEPTPLPAESLHRR